MEMLIFVEYTWYKLIMNNDASFNNNVDISENLYVNGDVSFKNLDISGRLIVQGNSFDGLRKDLNLLNNEDNLIGGRNIRFRFINVF